MILDALLDAFFDSVRALPFLIAAFALMEILEQHSNKIADRLFLKYRRSGPAVGAVLGLVPQCGFSAAMSNLYSGGVVTMGTLLAVFLSTSDEAVLIMMSIPEAIPKILPLLGTKLVIAVVCGFAVDVIFRNKSQEPHIDDLCADCGCHDHHGIVWPVAKHTGRVFIWLLIISFVLNILIESFGPEELAQLLGNNTFFQPFLTALVGLIPNCAVSVMFTKLYLAGSLSFASTIAGLSSGAGMGLLVLFRMDPNKKEAIRIVVILYLCAAAAGIVLNMLA